VTYLPASITRCHEVTRPGYGLGTSMYGMGVGMGMYPYGVTAGFSPYNFSGRVRTARRASSSGPAARTKGEVDNLSMVYPSD
jgi:hypothetical protein